MSTLRTLIERAETSGDGGGEYVGGADTGDLDFLKGILPGYPKPGSTSAWMLIDNVLSLAQTTINTTVDSIYLVNDLLTAGEQMGTAFIKEIDS